MTDFSNLVELRGNLFVDKITTPDPIKREIFDRFYAIVGDLILDAIEERYELP